MVALDKDNLTIKATDESFSGIVASFPNHIAKDIDKIAFTDFCIPSTDKFGIHFIHGIKGALVKTDDVFVSPMRICCKKYFLSFHKSPSVFCATFIPHPCNILNAPKHNLRNNPNSSEPGRKRRFFRHHQDWRGCNVALGHLCQVSNNTRR